MSTSPSPLPVSIFAASPDGKYYGRYPYGNKPAGAALTAIGAAVAMGIAGLSSSTVSNKIGLNIIGTNSNYPSYYDPTFLWLNACKTAGGNPPTPSTGNSIFGAAVSTTWWTLNNSNASTNEEAYLSFDAFGYVNSPTAVGTPPGGQQFTRIGSGFYNNVGLAAGATYNYPPGSYTFYFSGTFTMTFYSSDVQSGSLATSTTGVSVSGLTITSTLSSSQTGSVTFNIPTPTGSGVRYYIPAASFGSSGNYPQNFACVQSTYASLWLAGQVIHPLALSWLNQINIQSLRFMGLKAINSDFIGGASGSFGLLGNITNGQTSGTIGTSLFLNNFGNIAAGATSALVYSPLTQAAGTYTMTFQDQETRSVVLGTPWAGVISITNGSPNATLVSTSSGTLSVGMIIGGSGLPGTNGSTQCLVSSISGTAIVLSENATASNTAASVTASQASITWTTGLTNSVIANVWLNIAGPNWGLQGGTFLAWTNGQSTPIQVTLQAGSNAVTLSGVTANAAPYLYIQQWSTATRPTANTYSYASGKGGPCDEYCMTLCNAVNNGQGCDYWSNEPTWSLSDYWTMSYNLSFNGTGTTLPGFSGLNPGKIRHGEFGNELWNSGFTANFHFVQDMGGVYWPGNNQASESFRGMMPCLVADTAATIYGASAIGSGVLVWAGCQFGYGSGGDVNNVLKSTAWTSGGPAWSRKVNGLSTNPYSLAAPALPPMQAMAGPANSSQLTSRKCSASPMAALQWRALR